MSGAMLRRDGAAARASRSPAVVDSILRRATPRCDLVERFVRPHRPLIETSSRPRRDLFNVASASLRHLIETDIRCLFSESFVRFARFAFA
jgi:hypothetical protein